MMLICVRTCSLRMLHLYYCVYFTLLRRYVYVRTRIVRNRNTYTCDVVYVHYCASYTHRSCIMHQYIVHIIRHQHVRISYTMQHIYVYKNYMYMMIYVYRSMCTLTHAKKRWWRHLYVINMCTCVHVYIHICVYTHACTSTCVQIYIWYAYARQQYVQ